VVAVFQPHGFGPARFMRSELRDLLPALLRPDDRFCYAEIFYAGGTVAKDVSSAMLAADLPAALRCGYARDHAAVRAWVASEAHPGDTVLVMGARDGRVRIERVPRDVERGHDEAASIDATRPFPTRGIVAKKSYGVAVRGRSESADADLERGHPRCDGCQEVKRVVDRPIHERFENDTEPHGGRTYHRVDVLSTW